MPIQFITPSIISSVANTQVTGTITASQLATSLNLATNNVQVASIQSATGTPGITFAANGQVTLANTPLQLTGGQIVFPGTQIASGDANTLDDYEEGTFTPTINSGITSPTYSAQFGTYTKIGNVVTFSLRIDVSGGTRNGNILNFTLPFVAKTMSNNTGSASWAYVSSGVISSTTTNLPTLYVNSNANSIGCYRSDGATFLGTDLASTTPAFYLGGSYFTE